MFRRVFSLQLNAFIMFIMGSLSVMLIAPGSYAQAPNGATAQCNDGSYSKAKTERGACSSHGGVKTWFGASTADGKAAAKDASKPAKEPAPRATKDTATKDSASKETATKETATTKHSAEPKAAATAAKTQPPPAG